MKNNRPEVVILSVEEYERIKELADMAEHIGLAELIRERKTTPKELRMVWQKSESAGMI